MLTKTEWCWDFDGLVHEIEGMGPEGRFRLKGRCKRCWGGLIGKGHGDGIVPTAIRCRVCGLLLEGDKAKEEFQRMSEQANANTFNIAYNLPTKYRDDGKFVQKIFPYMARQSEDELCRRPNAEAQKIDHRDLLTRTSFPVGSAGFLVLQARAFMAGVEQLPWQLSVVPFSEVGMRDDPNAREKELVKRLGCTMTIAMNSAFSCELSMKAICLTRMDRARKNHDLWSLYRDLSEDSRARLEKDFPEVGSVLKEGRHTFGKWRYFEVNVGGHGMKAMIDTERAAALAKAARVLLDEAELMGLGYSVNAKATQERTTETGDRQYMHVKTKMDITATEAPPR